MRHAPGDVHLPAFAHGVLLGPGEGRLLGRWTGVQPGAVFRLVLRQKLFDAASAQRVERDVLIARDLLERNRSAQPAGGQALLALAQPSQIAAHLHHVLGVVATADATGRARDGHRRGHRVGFVDRETAHFGCLSLLINLISNTGSPVSLASECPDIG
jgi:hypothetical protein